MNFFGRSRQREQGVAAVALAVVLIFLVAVMGLAFDAAQLFVAKTELQNAMDSCALGAARELNTTNTTAANRLLILTRAETVGIFVAKRNRALFQSEEVALAADSDVTFSAALAGPWSTKGGAPLNTQYVRCTTRRTGIAMWLMGIFGHETEDVAAMAAASLQPAAASCYLPIGLCKTPAVPLVVGNWYHGKTGVPCLSGVCNFVNIAGLTQNADDIRDVIQGRGVCEVSLGTTIPAATGCKETVAEAWNSRFGIYKSNKVCTGDPNPGSPNPAANAPDFTGFAFTTTNWPAGSNAYSAAGGYITKKDGHAAYDGSDGVLDLTQPPYKNYCFLGPTQLGPPQNKAQDRRLVYLPIIDCPWDGKHQTTVRGTACVMLLTPMGKCDDEVYVEYLGENSAACASYGPPGGAGGTGPRVPTLVQ